MKAVDVYYQAEHIPEIEHLEVSGEDTIATVKARVCEKHGGTSQLLVFVEDVDDPLDEAASTASVADGAFLKLHLHCCHRIGVKVNFAGETVSRRFGPGTTVARVKRWAAEREFDMSKEEAGEHRLQIVGSQDRPVPGTHIGTLSASPDCSIDFDLVPDERINGAGEIDGQEES